MDQSSLFAEPKVHGAVGQFAAKATRKVDIYRLLTTSARIYLPSHPDGVSALFMRDSMSGKKAQYSTPFFLVTAVQGQMPGRRLRLRPVNRGARARRLPPGGQAAETRLRQVAPGRP